MRPQPVLVDMAQATLGPMQVTIDEDGLSRIKERYVVSTPLEGRLERVNLEVGDEVVANTTIIAHMQASDPSLLDPRALAQAEARVHAADRRLSAAKVEAMKADSSLEYQRNELARVKKLADTNAVSDADVDNRELEFRIASEEARVALFRVDIAEFELELERAALLLTHPGNERQSPGDVEMELSIKAPIDGRVLRIYRESAAVLKAGESIMEIGDPQDLEIVVDVLSADAVKISPGNAVRLENWGGTQPLLGEVRVVEPSGFTKLSALGVEEQRVNVIIDLLDPIRDRESFGDGFRVDAKIVVWQSPEVLQVPTSSLFRMQNAWGLFRISPEGKAELAQVEIGHNNGVQAEIRQGVLVDDRVIVHPSDSVSDGVSVALRDGAH